MASIRRMDDEEYKRRLSEVAEWKLPETPRETSLNAKKKRGRKSAEEKYQDEHEEVFMELFEGTNPTYTPLLTKIKYATITCECGRVCDSGCQKEAKLFQTQTKAVWRWKCKTCGMTQDPYTGEYTLNSQRGSIVWAEYLRKCNPVYVKIAERKQVTNDDDGIITKYPETQREN
jgi:hypothetical protein